MLDLSRLRYAEILKLNAELRASGGGAEPIPVRVLANTTLSPLREIAECWLRLRGIEAAVELGDYDNVVQGLLTDDPAAAHLVFLELAALAPGLHYRVESMSASALSAFAAALEEDLSVALEAMARRPLVLLNRFSATPFTAGGLCFPALRELASRLNEFVARRTPPSVKLVDTEGLFAEVSVEEAIDLARFRSTGCLYTPRFLAAYTERALPPLAALLGKARKALVLDCDGTLWPGTVGESGIPGLDLRSDSPAGAVYREVQHLLKALALRGVLLVLCSKNNPEDVDEVFSKHPDMVLAEEDIVLRKVSWQDKAVSLQEIASELNIGLDSLVFLDDSPFEIERIRAALPEVICVRVPERLDEYPRVLRRAANLFCRSERSDEDGDKSRMYRVDMRRREEKARFVSLDDYLKTLSLQLTLHVNDPSLLSRLAQLTQKTNQFNLRTRRYTEADLRRFLESGRHFVFAGEVSDKFGGHGITALCIAALDLDARTAFLDTFLLSCRVIGRTIESAFLREVLACLAGAGVEAVTAGFRPTAKNAQVSRFYDSMGFRALSSGPEERIYRLELGAKGIDPSAFVRINYGTPAAGGTGLGPGDCPGRAQ